ncbi:MAG TPA: GNAT family N-acetyltransferase [Rubrobacter sp.]|nr:GNAT family N-acetyltransferase [Rubrobacter sp.]
MTIRRSVGRFGARFSALLGERELGGCECVADLGRGGALPALRGWAELSEVYVAEGWRNRGIGSWLVGTAADWLRLCRRDRVVLAVDEDDETAGAGRFYRRFGWEVLAREVGPWSRETG